MERLVQSVCQSPLLVRVRPGLERFHVEGHFDRTAVFPGGCAFVVHPHSLAWATPPSRPARNCVAHEAAEGTGAAPAAGTDFSRHAQCGELFGVQPITPGFGVRGPRARLHGRSIRLNSSMSGALGKVSPGQESWNKQARRQRSCGPRRGPVVSGSFEGLECAAEGEAQGTAQGAPVGDVSVDQAVGGGPSERGEGGDHEQDGSELVDRDDPPAEAA